MKKGILIVSFGTTHRETREKNIEKIAETVREQFPDCEVSQAYSSDKVLSILKKRDGVSIPDISEALSLMKEAGIRQVSILPTHIIDGYENHKMKQIAAEHQKDFQSLRIAGALLEEEEDYEMVAKALWKSLKEIVGESTVILMGHGSNHEADKSYEKMEQTLRRVSERDIYMATVEGRISIEDVIKKLEGKKHSVFLTPFMLVAGDHAVNDMAGEEDSFAAKLKAAGMEVECLLKGLGEYKDIRDIYSRHLQKVMIDKEFDFA